MHFHDWFGTKTRFADTGKRQLENMTIFFKTYYKIQVFAKQIDLLGKSITLGIFFT